MSNSTKKTTGLLGSGRIPRAGNGSLVGALIDEMFELDICTNDDEEDLFPDAADNNTNTKQPYRYAPNLPLMRRLLSDAIGDMTARQFRVMVGESANGDSRESYQNRVRSATADTPNSNRDLFWINKWLQQSCWGFTGRLLICDCTKNTPELYEIVDSLRSNEVFAELLRDDTKVMDNDMMLVHNYLGVPWLASTSLNKYKGH